MKKLFKIITKIMLVLSIIFNGYFIVKHIQTKSLLLTMYYRNITALNNNSIELKKQIDSDFFNKDLLIETLERDKGYFLELSNITEILLVTNNEIIPYGYINQYIRFIDDKIKSIDSNFSMSEIKDINIFISDIEKINFNIEDVKYLSDRKNFQIIDQKYKSD